MPAILVLTGASGAGKTTLTRAFDAEQIPGVVCVQCDRIYHSLPEEVRADGETAQDAILEYWVNHVCSLPGARLGVLETQIRPHKAIALLKRLGVMRYQVVLVECEHSTREARLHGPRNQPELATLQMACWAAYLRGQCDVLHLERIVTSDEPLTDSVARLRAIVDPLISESGSSQGRLVIVCGLPGSGKTTLAKSIATQADHSVRFSADDWMATSGINLWDEAARAQIEKSQWQLAQSLLAQGRTVIVEWGSWSRAERDTLRLAARALGARVELHFLDAPVEVLFERIAARNMESPRIQLGDLRRWSATIERPTSSEIALFDPVH